MATRPLAEATEPCFAAYIGELHEFFATSGIAFGSPQDFPAFAERLHQSGPFADDLGSLLRSIVLRQGGAMPHAQLLEIVSAAVAGPEMAQAPQLYREPLRQLLAFVSGVMRRPWNVPPGEPAQVVPFPKETAARPAVDSAEPANVEPDAGASAVPQAIAPPLPLTASLDPVPAVPRMPQPLPQQQQQPEPAPSHSAIPAALAESKRRSPEQPEPILHQAPEPEPLPGSLTDIETTPRSPRLLRNLAIGAVAAVLLAAVVVTAFHLRKPAPTATATASGPVPQNPPAPAPTPQPVATGVSHPPNPSAYGQALAPHQVHRPPVPPSAWDYPAAPAYTPPSTQAAESHPPDGPQSVPSTVYGPYNPAEQAPAPIVRSPSVNDPDARIVGEPQGGDGFLPAPAGRPTYFAVSAGAMAANLISAPSPGYPLLARLAHIHGQVVLQALVAKDGTISTARVLRGNHLLRGAAENAVRRWRYRPYRIAGQPVNVSTIVTVDFRDAH